MRRLLRPPLALLSSARLRARLFSFSIPRPGRAVFISVARRAEKSGPAVRCEAHPSHREVAPKIVPGSRAPGRETRDERRCRPQLLSPRRVNKCCFCRNVAFTEDMLLSDFHSERCMNFSGIKKTGGVRTQKLSTDHVGCIFDLFPEPSRGGHPCGSVGRPLLAGSLAAQPRAARRWRATRRRACTTGTRRAVNEE